MIVIKVLQRVLVDHFYKVNAGFFLFGFFVLFGLPQHPVSFHRSLIIGIIDSQAFIGVVMIGWTLYCIKCIDYITRQIREPQQTFLFCLNSLPIGKPFRNMVYVHTMVYLPVLVYALIITTTAIAKHAYLFAGEVILFCAASTLLPAYVYLLAIQKRKVFGNAVIPAVFSWQVRKRLFAMPLVYLWSQRKQMLMVTKLFSLVLLYLFITLYEPERHDTRPLLLCLLLVAGAHTSIIYQVRSFELEYLSFSRNLPIHIGKRFLGLMLMYLVLMLPELLFLWKGYGLHFILNDYPEMVLMIVALLTIFHTTLLLEDTSMDQFMRVVFGMMAAMFFILLYSPGIFLPVAVLLLSFVLFASYYYTYERSV